MRRPRSGGRNTIRVAEPGGHYGSIGNRLMKIHDLGDYNVELTDSEWRRLSAWFDMNAIFYGVYLPEDQERQRNGEIASSPEIQRSFETFNEILDLSLFLKRQRSLGWHFLRFFKGGSKNITGG
ncbi:MAG: hypothetical protein Q4C95_07360 [Planctomycetia bacterium]|nr:hypothetical protein [Planctomycetia bacterium]